RWRSVTRSNLKSLANEASGCPVAHSDQAATTADALQFGGNDCRTRRKHCAKHRRDHVEAARLVRELFRVAFDKVDFQIFFRGPCSRLLEQVGGDIQARHCGTAT